MAIKSRALHHQKQFKVLTGKGLPSPGEGFDGDIQLRSTKDGLKLFVKYGQKWWQMGEAATQISGSDGNAPSMSGNPLSIEAQATRINRVTNNIELRGALMLGDRNLTIAPTSGRGKFTHRRINYSGKKNRGLTFDSADKALFDDVNVMIESGHKLSFDGASEETYITESSADILDFYIGGDKLLELKETSIGNLITIEDNTDMELVGRSNSSSGNGVITFLTKRESGGTIQDGQDGDDLGKILFDGYNDAGTPERYSYGYILGEIADASDSAEKGKITIDSSEIALDANTVTISSGNLQGDPDLNLYSTYNGSLGANLDFTHIRGESAAGQDGDNLGYIRWYGHNDAPEDVQYAKIAGSIGDATDGTETGKLRFQVLAKEAVDLNSPATGLTL